MTTIPYNGREIPVLGDDSADVLKSSMFTDWIVSMDPSFDITQIEIQSISKRPRTGRMLMIKLKVTLADSETTHFWPIVILRDMAVAGLCVLLCDGHSYVVLVRQPRIAVGQKVYELPAGLIDADATPAEVIMWEFEEEAQLVTHLGITADMIRPLGHHSLDSSPGFTNESLYYFYIEQQITREQLEKLQGLEAGLRDHGESITVEIVSYHEVVQKCQDPKTLAALYLYEHRND